MNFIKNSSIKKKLLLGYLSVYLVFLAVAIWVFTSIIQRAAQANIESELSNTNKTILSMVKAAANVSVKNYLRAVVEKGKDIVEHVYQQFRAGKLSEQEAKDLAVSLLLSQRIGKTGYIYCVDSHGIIRVHPKQALHNVDLSLYAFIRAQIQLREGYISYDWKNPGEAKARPKALYMNYFQPWDWIISASSYRDEFIQLINIENFRDSIQSLRFGKTGYSYVMDSNATMIIHPFLQGKNLLETRDSYGLPLFRQLCSRKNGMITYYWQNPGDSAPRRKMDIFNYIPEYDWIVASSGYMEEFFEPIQIVWLSSGVLACLSVVVVFLLTFFYATYINRHLKTVIRHLDAVGEKDYSSRIQISSQDEFGELSRGINDFLQRLETSREKLELEIEERKRAVAAHQKAEDDIRQLNEELEQRVKDRTKALEGLNAELQAAKERLEKAYEELKATQSRILQQEKMASIGVLSAGIAHEINNPMAFIISNLATLEKYVNAVVEILAFQTAAFQTFPSSEEQHRQILLAIEEKKSAVKLNFILGDLADLIKESLDGANRVKNIVQDLKNFSHLDEPEAKVNDIVSGIESTINIIWNELKYKATVVKEFEAIPPTRCNLGQLNQVFMNLLLNSVQAIEKHGTITIRTWSDARSLFVSVSDDGMGIPADKLPRIFEPFFTTKDVGKGTGLGLSIAYDIIRKHDGTIGVVSECGKGTTFTLSLPIVPE